MPYVIDSCTSGKNNIITAKWKRCECMSMAVNDPVCITRTASLHTSSPYPYAMHSWQSLHIIAMVFASIHIHQPRDVEHYVCGSPTREHVWKVPCIQQQIGRENTTSKSWTKTAAEKKTTTALYSSRTGIFRDETRLHGCISIVLTEYTLFASA